MAALSLVLFLFIGLPLLFIAAGNIRYSTDQIVDKAVDQYNALKRND